MKHTGCATVAGGGAIDRERSAVAMHWKCRSGPAVRGAPRINNCADYMNGNPVRHPGGGHKSKSRSSKGTHTHG